MFNFLLRSALNFLLILPFTISSNAQVYTGGTIGVNYDIGYYFEAAPILGYRYKNRVDMGISPFASYRERSGQSDYYTFGNRVFTQVTIIKDVFGHAEFQVSNVEITSSQTTGGTIKRKWIMGMPVGGGYRYSISKNAEAYGMILYDVLLDKDSPVKNPVIRGGINYKL